MQSADRGPAAARRGADEASVNAPLEQVTLVTAAQHQRVAAVAEVARQRPYRPGWEGSGVGGDLGQLDRVVQVDRTVGPGGDDLGQAAVEDSADGLDGVRSNRTDLTGLVHRHLQQTLGRPDHDDDGADLGPGDDGEPRDLPAARGELGARFGVVERATLDSSVQAAAEGVEHASVRGGGERVDLGVVAHRKLGAELSGVRVPVEHTVVEPAAEQVGTAGRQRAHGSSVAERLQLRAGLRVYDADLAGGPGAGQERSRGRGPAGHRRDRAVGAEKGPHGLQDVGAEAADLDVAVEVARRDDHALGGAGAGDRVDLAAVPRRLHQRTVGGTVVPP